MLAKLRLSFPMRCSVNTFQRCQPTHSDILLDASKTLAATNYPLLHRGYNGSVFSNYSKIIMWLRETADLILWCLVFWIKISLYGSNGMLHEGLSQELTCCRNNSRLKMKYWVLN